MEKLSFETKTQLLETLKTRFEQNPGRHEGISWNDVLEKITASPNKLSAILKMEETGGQPDVVMLNPNILSFVDCSPESPTGRRSCCYDRASLDSRKENKPASNAVEMAQSIGISILDETKYRILQSIGEFDLKTSSWIYTPQQIRELGGALFCDRRYKTVFVYHNGAESYYAARGFRGYLEI